MIELISQAVEPADKAGTAFDGIMRGLQAASKLVWSPVLRGVGKAIQSAKEETSANLKHTARNRYTQTELSCV